MDKIITVDKSTNTNTNGQMIRTWSVRHNEVYASFEPVSGGETTRGRSVEAGTDAMFVVRAQPTDPYSVQDRIYFDGEYWYIKQVHKAGGGNEFVELHASKVPA